MTRTVQCIYLKKEAEGLSFAPYPGELGKRIYDNVRINGPMGLVITEDRKIDLRRITGELLQASSGGWACFARPQYRNITGKLL